MNDEGFREIQLNGKQLVFLFMAATVVAVVIFLCGVLVGRGVRGEASSGMASTGVGPDSGLTAAPEDTVPPQAASPPSGAPDNPGDAPPPGDLSYPDRLLGNAPSDEKLAGPLEAPIAPRAPPTPAPPVEERVAVPAPEAPVAAPAPSDPLGQGFAVQVAAYRDRREAESLVNELLGKGYPAFVMDPVKGAPTTMFRVRVGKYKTLKDAEAVSARLQKAEQFKPWIAR